MKHKRFIGALGVAGLALLLFGADYAFAHCDGLDGPVVKAAQKALQTNNVNLVLIWVQKESEPELKAVFQQTVAVRKLSPESKALADRHLFETLVRLHRAGEGAPYTTSWNVSTKRAPTRRPGTTPRRSRVSAPQGSPLGGMNRVDAQA